MIALLLVIHFVADFLLQSREMGKKKSSDPHYLFQHLAIQYACFMVVLLPFAEHPVYFALANAALHGIIDWNIWRLYKAAAYMRIKKYPQHPLLTNNQAEPWKFWEDHWFYATIGFDQLLHGLTLVLLAWWFGL